MAARRRPWFRIVLVSLCGAAATACTTSPAAPADSTPSADQATVGTDGRDVPPTPSPDSSTPADSPAPTSSPADGSDDGPGTGTPDPVDQGGGPAATTPTAVNVTFGGWQAATSSVEVGGYAAVIEDDGTCTLQLSQGGESVTATSAAFADAATTSCGTLTIAGTNLRPGTWTAVLRYDSPRSAGESTPITIEVPR